MYIKCRRNLNLITLYLICYLTHFFFHRVYIIQIISWHDHLTQFYCFFLPFLEDIFRHPGKFEVGCGYGRWLISCFILESLWSKSFPDQFIHINDWYIRMVKKVPSFIIFSYWQWFQCSGIRNGIIRANLDKWDLTLLLLHPLQQMDDCYSQNS